MRGRLLAFAALSLCCAAPAAAQVPALNLPAGVVKVVRGAVLLERGQQRHAAAVGALVLVGEREPVVPTADEVPEPRNRRVGLDITRNVVLEHRESLTLSSLPGEGTMFQIALPLAGEGAA